MKNILVTGGRGFIGFNAIRLWKSIRPDLTFVNLDAGTYADQYKILEKNMALDNWNVPHFVLDLSSDKAPESISSIVQTFDIDTMVLFAAESHVDNSINSPCTFFQSNIIGCINCLEIARKFNLRVHYVSTDEVYGITTPDDYIDECSPLKPSSPYSSSKASADLICQSYWKTYGLNVTISRCCNNFGEFQAEEKFIPTVLRKLKAGEKIPVYGDGKQYRQWIYVDDHNSAILDILENGIPGKIYNVSSNKIGYMQNLDVISFFAEEYGKNPNSVIEFVKDRPGHDTSYFISNYKNIEYTKEYLKSCLLKTLKFYNS